MIPGIKCPSLAIAGLEKSPGQSRCLVEIAVMQAQGKPITLRALSSALGIALDAVAVQVRKLAWQGHVVWDWEASGRHVTAGIRLKKPLVFKEVP